MEIWCTLAALVLSFLLLFVAGLFVLAQQFLLEFYDKERNDLGTISIRTTTWTQYARAARTSLILP